MSKPPRLNDEVHTFRGSLTGDYQAFKFSFLEDRDGRAELKRQVSSFEYWAEITDREVFKRKLPPIGYLFTTAKPANPTQTWEVCATYLTEKEVDVRPQFYCRCCTIPSLGYVFSSGCFEYEVVYVRHTDPKRYPVLRLKYIGPIPHEEPTTL